ncbi:MAG: cytidine deaminase [Lachnospiraceae bacterium]|nr:cytidine deaminase [Lachnospiraceae bacterium]
MDEKKIKELIKEAFIARRNAYTPYSGFNVGAALLCADGRIIHGCNIENASYGATNCAERTAFFKAVSEGIRDFSAIAIVGGPKDEEDTVSVDAYPCGICRQVMTEFCRRDFQVIIARSESEYQSFSLDEIIPHGFYPDALL